MKQTNSFVLFGRAFKYARRDFWVSIQVLFWITLALSLIFYLVEHKAQPDEYSNIWECFVWAITRYIGDPGKFAGNGPVTLTGRYIDTAIGILKILIFAVPAGLVSNGFRKSIEEDKKRLHLEECHERITKAFRRTVNRSHHYRVPPRNISLVTLQAKKGMTENDIIDTVNRYPDFRLRNLALSQTNAEHPQDRLVIEKIPLEEQTVDGYPIEHTDYGIKIDRKSAITIVAPTSATECTIGYFAYYVAQFGGFNLVSREFVKDADDPISYYTISEESMEQVKPFIDDINSLSSMSGKAHWNIILISADNVHDTQIHLVSKFKHDNQTSPTVLDKPCLEQFFTALSHAMEQHQLSCEKDEIYRPVGPRNLSVKTGGGSTNNALTLRVSYSATTWTASCTPIALDIAKAIRQTLAPDGQREFTEHSGWKLTGNGYGIDKGTQE